MKAERIVSGTITEIYEDKIVVNVEGKLYDCPTKMISDYPVETFKFFKKNTKYQFLLIDNSILSYKDLRPKLLKNRTKPIPTVSGSKTLEKNLNNFIKKNM